MPIGITCEEMTRFTRYPHLGGSDAGTSDGVTPWRRMQLQDRFLFLPEL
jgi:hypothetical protein